MYRNLNELLHERCESAHGLTFILSDTSEKTMLYRDLYEIARGILHNLQAHGLKPGDELLFQIDNNESFIYLFWACLLGKIIPVPITVGNNDEHMLKVFRIWSVVHNPYLITNEKRLASIGSFAEEKGMSEAFDAVKRRTLTWETVQQISGQGEVLDPQPDDVAFIQFSSGSTGDPKGVVLTHKNLLANLNAIAIGLKTTTEDRNLTWLPLTHDMGLIGCHMLPLFAGFHQFSMEAALFMRRPMLWLKKASEHKVTLLTAPNFAYRLVLQNFKPEMAEEWNLSSIKAVINGAEPIAAEVVRQFFRTFEPYQLRPGSVFNVYGLAEASLAVTFPPLGEGLVVAQMNRRKLAVGDAVQEVQDKSGKHTVEIVELGKPVTDCAVRIIDETNRDLGENVVGYVQIKGDNVTAGYYNNPEKTKQLISEEGWLNTGDLGFLRKGRLYITGRAKDILFVQGQNYYPHDIERIVSDVEGVERGEAAVCGVYNETLHGDELLLFVMYRKKMENFAPVALEVKKRVSQEIGLTVDHVIPIKSIPKTTSGKTQRFKLAERYQEGEFEDVLQEVRALLHSGTDEADLDAEKVLLNIAREVLGIEEIGLHDNFTKFGCTSVQMTKMHEQLERRYPGRVKIPDLFAFPSVSMLVDYIEGKGSILVPAVRLPESFFQNVSDERGSSSFEIQLDRDLTGMLVGCAAHEKVEVADILLGLCLNLFAQLSGNPLVTIQSQIASREQLVPVTVNFQQVSHFSELFRHVQAIARSTGGEGGISIADLNKIVRNKDPHAVVVSFCDRDVKAQEIIHHFDLVIELDASAEGIGLQFEYNSRRLNKERVKQLAVDFVKVTKMLGKALEHQK